MFMKSFNYRTVLRYVIIGILLPLFVQYIIFFRYTGNYMLDVYSEKGFNKFYNNDVFRYRVLGKAFFLRLYSKLTENPKIKKAGSSIYDKRLTALDAEADIAFYFTYFLVATIFTILSALALLYLFDSVSLFEMTEQKKIFFTSGIVCLTGFLEYVVTPYDNLTYFFFIAASLLFLRFLQTKRWLYYILLNVIIVLATLNHESALLNLSFLVAVYYSCYGFHFKWMRLAIVPVVLYLFTWVGLRLFIGHDEPGAVTGGLKLLRNLNMLNVASFMGIIFSVFVFYFLFKLAEPSNNRKNVLNFLVMASPYIIMIPVIGLIVEARLWMPVIIGGVLIGQLNLKAFRPLGVSK